MAEPHQSWLVANGTSGAWDVELDATDIAGDRRFQLALSTPTFHLAFRVTGGDAVRAAIDFLRTTAGRPIFAELDWGTIGSQRVRLVKDAEFAGRYFIKVLGAPGLVELTLAAADAEALGLALTQAAADL